ncbi:13798_t:CDS:2 [Funneliformis caledonium]|uniref:13798_t:CDS:1 n=1 Tax=Funneliformis caledonium TaxID=1117310 RepID=A0A9N8WAL8_9GLOM|nr:13798_t:CDS:2 [Funneliformis caledonium]
MNQWSFYGCVYIAQFLENREQFAYLTGWMTPDVMKDPQDVVRRQDNNNSNVTCQTDSKRVLFSQRPTTLHDMVQALIKGFTRDYRFVKGANYL